MVVTHPDLEHIGNLENLLNEVEIVNAFLPYVKENSLYVDYGEIVQKIKSKNVNLNYAIINKSIVGEDYLLRFLSPLYPDSKESSYLDFNMNDFPTEEEKNNLSSIIYLEYAKVKFLFTGDAGILQEKVVTKLYKSNVYNDVGNNAVVLEDIDFLKVSNGSGACSQKFLTLIKPNNAVLSVGAEKGNGSFNLIQKLVNCNEHINIYRTDVDGATSVLVKPNGLVNVVTAKNITI